MNTQEVETWLSNRQEQLRQGIKPIVHDLKTLVTSHDFVFLLIDGPQGIGKTRYLEPVFQEMMEQTVGFTPETICTNYTMISREERSALSKDTYEDLWNWYRFPKLVNFMSDAIDAHRAGKSSITLTDWYNRAKGGIIDHEPLKIGLKPIMIVEGIGALSKDVLDLLKREQVPFISVMFNAPQELRFSWILKARSYRKPEEQVMLMKTVDDSYFAHYPGLLKNAKYYAFLTKTDFFVSKTC